ncbi:hypothetical protein VitviT2T_000426 [Vitis vinifera]|uniref:Bet v I/Major latex protein domain-containing protein n=1 Tax=Vitis vinifera TaxID=29760 RepID=A0ABY9BD45_VITVI|nr:hypothetical protein VitviT2T_000426 [Vitis vinifera]
MGLVGKLEAEILILAPADKFHEVWGGRPHHMSSVSPGKVQKVDLHEGDWGNVGSVIEWSYVIGKLQAETLIVAPADKFHEMFSCRPHHISNVCPEKIQKVNLHEGEWGTSGYVIEWNYNIGGRFEWRLDEVEKADGTTEDPYPLPSPLYSMAKSQVFCCTTA